jgi:hypothetical protein
VRNLAVRLVRKGRTVKSLVLLLGVLIPGIGFAQQYCIGWHNISGGGGASGNGPYLVSGAIGQPVAGAPMTGANYSLTGGFWTLMYSPPVAANLVLQRDQNSGAKVRLATLLAGGSDPQNAALAFISAGPASAYGGTVAVSGNWLLYTPPPGFTNSDAFSYVIADSQGMQAAGTVSISVPVELGQSQNMVDFEDLGNGSFFIQFQAIPGRAYTIQYSESLQNPVWQTLGTSTADATGAIAFTNAPASGSPAGFYRSTYP